jgi:hypothetical protein
MNAIPRNRFQVIAVAALAIVIVLSFARTYYLKVLFHLPPLGLAAHLHGLLATVWLGVHYTQARLVAAHRIDVHKRLGMFGAVLGGVLAVQALHLGISSAAEGGASGTSVCCFSRHSHCSFRPPGDSTLWSYPSDFRVE